MFKINLKTIVLSALAITASLSLTGCAGYKINDDGSATSWGFLRTMTVKREFYEGGQLKSHEITTQSNTGDVLMGLNELAKTGVDTAAKLKP